MTVADVASGASLDFDAKPSGHRRIARASPKTPARDDNTRTARARPCDMNGPTLKTNHPVATTDRAVDPPLIVALIRPARHRPCARRSLHNAKNPAIPWE